MAESDDGTMSGITIVEDTKTKRTNTIINVIPATRGRRRAPGRMEGIKITIKNGIMSNETDKRIPNINRNITITWNVTRTNI